MPLNEVLRQGFLVLLEQGGPLKGVLVGIRVVNQVRSEGVVLDQAARATESQANIAPGAGHCACLIRPELA